MGDGVGVGGDGVVLCGLGGTAGVAWICWQTGRGGGVIFGGFGGAALITCLCGLFVAIGVSPGTCE